MSHRCVVVLGGESPACFWSKYAGYFIERYLMHRGPGDFEQMVRDSWMPGPPIDDTFTEHHLGGTESGVFIDPTAKQVLLCGGHETMHDADRARIEVALISAQWSGWDVRWFAMDWDLVRAGLGLPSRIPPIRERVVRFQPDPGPDWAIGEEGRWPIVVAVNDGGELRLARTRSNVRELVSRGLAIKDDPGWASALTLEHPPIEGLYLDLDSQTFNYWVHHRWSALHELRAALPGWGELRLWSVLEFEEVVGPQLTVRRPSDEELIRRVADSMWPELAMSDAQILPGLILALGYEELAYELDENWPYDWQR